MYFDGVAEVSGRDRLPIFPQRRGDGPPIHDCQVRDGKTLQFIACVPTSHPVGPNSGANGRITVPQTGV
jgi:hypothetical protein